MGWSTWNVPGKDPTAANVEAAALALKTSGLLAAGYNYVNVDDFWYDCPGSQGPDVDAYGRWVTNASEFPPSGSTNGIQVVANYVHSLGEKFGIYVTPGISDQAVAENTPIEGTSYTADEIADGASEKNYNCGGMQGIDYSKPGAGVHQLLGR
jgi:alpha-galactosidase